jgi:hypothetical protein
MAGDGVVSPKERLLLAEQLAGHIVDAALLDQTGLLTDDDVNRIADGINAVKSVAELLGGPQVVIDVQSIGIQISQEILSVVQPEDDSPPPPASSDKGGRSR